MESLTPGTELLSATAIEKTSSMEVTRIKKGLVGEKIENVSKTGSQRTSRKSLTVNTLWQLDIAVTVWLPYNVVG